MERAKKPRRGASMSARPALDLNNDPSGDDVAAANLTPQPEVTQPPAKTSDELADEQAGLLVQGAPLVPRDMTLNIKLSRQLHSKLLRSAQDEGVPLEALIHELLAEGATLRAWEIIERKHAMRGQQSQQPTQGGANQRQFNGQFGNARHQQGARNGGPNHGRPSGPQGRGGGNGRPPSGTAWMDDKAAFLEYVRNQEKRRR